MSIATNLQFKKENSEPNLEVETISMVRRGRTNISSRTQVTSDVSLSVMGESLLYDYEYRGLEATTQSSDAAFCWGEASSRMTFALLSSLLNRNIGVIRNFTPKRPQRQLSTTECSSMLGQAFAESIVGNLTGRCVMVVGQTDTVEGLLRQLHGALSGGLVLHWTDLHLWRPEVLSSLSQKVEAIRIACKSVKKTSQVHELSPAVRHLHRRKSTDSITLPKVNIT
ncbi:unnamed protein product [Sphagnum jensenii]|uniref:Uncharacterized protein n=1 Tax=Sphagnum jensenii TaxID=128206 RepID=A0ABP0VHP9_9BRYO